MVSIDPMKTGSRWKIRQVMFLLIFSLFSSVQAYADVEFEKGIQTKENELPRSQNSFSRFAIFAEVGPGAYFLLYPNQVFGGPFLSAAAGVSISQFDSCNSRENGFCARILLTGKFGISYAPPHESILINPMLGAESILLFGKKRWVGVMISAALGYGFSTNAGVNPHSVRLDLGTGLWVNLRPTRSRFAVYVRANFDPIGKLLSFPIGFNARF